jgi:hypothetical protein
MTIRSALEDFVKTTLGALPGYWQKLVYFAELRRDDPTYEHWGMHRRYGTAASVSAMGAAHTDVFLRILRTPLRTLLEDLRSSAQPQNRTQGEYLERLREQEEAILPADDGGGTRRHFEVTLQALEALIRAEKPPADAANRPGE